MKKFKILTILFICLFTFNVKADTNLKTIYKHVFIDNNGIHVYSSYLARDLFDNEVSEILSYDNGVLTIFEDVYITSIQTSIPNLKITSNGKRFYLYNLETTQSDDSEIEYNIEFDDAYIAMPTYDGDMVKVYEPKNAQIIINNSNLNVKGVASDSVVINNSNVIYNSGIYDKIFDIDVNDSYLKCSEVQFGKLNINNSTLLANRLDIHKSLTLNNSLIKVESEGEINYSIVRFFYEEEGLNKWIVSMTNDGVLLNNRSFDVRIFDAEGALKNKYVGFLNKDGSYSNSINLTQYYKVTFHTDSQWLDGTNDDIIIYKKPNSLIEYSDLPSSKISMDVFVGNNWNHSPMSFSVDKNNENFILQSVKGVEENPKTGLFNDILLFIPVIISILGFNYLKRLELFKKM